MKPLQILRTLAGVAALGWMALAPAQAQVTVRMMHVDQNPNTQAFYADMARRYEAMKPGVKVEVLYLENQAYKSKLTTLLQSPERPNIIYSWGGGVMRDQVKAGVIEDLTAPMNAQWKERFIPSAIQSFTLDNKILGVPFQTAQVGFFYNKDLFTKAKVDANTIKTWPDLLAAVKKLQAAGITPIITGGADKWPLHFYWSHLAIRAGGKPAFEAALRGEGKGFADETFVRAGELFKQLADLKPFQQGYLGTTFPQSAGMFGDGKGAMHLQLNGMLGSMAANSADKVGIPDDKLGWFPFPTVPNGKGNATDTLGGMNGWLVTKGSPKEAADFLRFFTEVQNQQVAAEKGLYLPVVVGSTESLKRPILRQLAENVGKAKYHQVYYDQMLGASVGAVVNDISQALAADRIKPEAAAQAVQAAWKQASN